MVYKVTLPLITNSCLIKKGEELILRKAEQKDDKSKIATWRTDIKTRAAESAAKAKAKAQAKSKGSVKDI